MKRFQSYGVVWLVVSLWLLTGCAPSLNEEAPRAHAGTLDLRHWSFTAEAPLSLSGSWGFYWHRFVSPNALMEDWPDSPPVTNVPDRWRGVTEAGEPVPSRGYATYFLRILLPEDVPPLALKVRDAGTAYRLYAGDRLVHAAGTVGVNAEQSIPGFKKAVIALPKGTANELLLVMHVSNFQYRIGGLWEHVVLGASADVHQYSDRVLGYSIFLASGIGVIGLYHLGLFTLRRRDTASLFFGLACLDAVARQLSTDERYLSDLIPSITQEMLFRIEYLSMVLGMYLFAAYLRRLLPGCAPGWMVPATLVFGLVFAGIILFSDLLVYSTLLPVFQLYVLAAVACAFYTIYRAVRQRQEMAWGFLAGFTVLAIAVVNDVAKSMDLFDSPYYLIGAGLFVFILIQSYAMSRLSAQAYAKVEALTRELEAYSSTLEESVQERTAELAAANAKLEQLAMFDELTQVANRRHFDEALENEWNRARRNGTPLSLLVIDIDKFKAYNDTYGHLKGDETLRRVAEAIASTLSRSADLVARYGGEEFVVLLPDTTLEGAASLGEKILAAVAQLLIVHTESVHGHVTVSIGGASVRPAEGLMSRSLVQSADQSLFRAKTKGRNRLVLDPGSGVDKPGRNEKKWYW